MVAKLSLVECMAAVEDPRVDRTKAHDLQDILVLAVLAVLCGADGSEDIDLFADGWRLFLAIKDNHLTLHKSMSEHFDQIHEKGCIGTGVQHHRSRPRGMLGDSILRRTRGSWSDQSPEAASWRAWVIPQGKRINLETSKEHTRKKRKRAAPDENDLLICLSEIIEDAVAVLRTLVEASYFALRMFVFMEKRENHRGNWIPGVENRKTNVSVVQDGASTMHSYPKKVFRKEIIIIPLGTPKTSTFLIYMTCNTCSKPF